MKWSLETEEQFSDLSIISMITANKSPVKGNFEDGIYIKGRRTEFERVSVCGGRLEHLLCLLVADGELNHQTVYAYIYFLRSNENIYRCYFFCSELKREEICYLAKMIIGNIEMTNESDREGITLRKRDGKVK